MNSLVSTLIIGLTFLFWEGTVGTGQGIWQQMLGRLFSRVPVASDIPFSAYDLIVVACLYLLLLSVFVRRNAASPLSLALSSSTTMAVLSALTFVNYLVVNMLLSIGKGNELGKVLLQFRPFLWGLLVAFFVCRANSSHVERVIRAFLWLRAGVVIGVYLLQGASGFLPAWESGDGILFSYGLLSSSFRILRVGIRFTDISTMLISLGILLGAGRRAPLTGIIVAYAVAWFFRVISWMRGRRGFPVYRVGAIVAISLLCLSGLSIMLPQPLWEIISNRLVNAISDPDAAMSYRRLENYYAIRAIASMSPMEIAIGKGLGSYNAAEIPYALGNTGNYYWYSIHNSWLQLMLVGGVIGILLFVNMWVWLTRATLKMEEGPAVVLSAVVMMVGMSTGQWLWSVRTLAIIGILFGKELRKTLEYSRGSKTGLIGQGDSAL